MRTIIHKLVAGAVLVASATVISVPASARSGDHDGYYEARYGDRYDDRYGDRYERRNDREYRGYNDYRRDRGYRNYRGQRCDRGTGGTIIGAIAGGLLGNEIVGRRGDKTAGVILKPQ